MRFRTLAVVSLIALSTAGCGSSGGSGSGGDVTLPAGTVVVKAIEGIAWDKATYEATSVDGKVSIAVENLSSLPHNLHLVDSQSVDEGISLEVNGRNDIESTTLPLAPGDYKVICTIAGHGNMKATLTVK
jgi:plastocyanin